MAQGIRQPIHSVASLAVPIETDGNASAAGRHKREGRGREGGIGLERQREETETAVNARGFGEVGDSEACELAVNPVQAGASSQRAPFSRGTEKKKRTPYRAMETARNGQLCRQGPASRLADKGGSEEAGESRSPEQTGFSSSQGNGERCPCMQLSFSFVFFRDVCTHNPPYHLLRASDKSGNYASARTCVTSSANFLFSSVFSQAVKDFDLMITSRLRLVKFDLCIHDGVQVSALLQTKVKDKIMSLLRVRLSW